jgi:hypothetical protein
MAESNFPYAAGKNSQQRKEAAKRIHDNEFGKMLWICATMVTSFIGYLTIIYLIVQFILTIW